MDAWARARARAKARFERHVAASLLMSATAAAPPAPPSPASPKPGGGASGLARNSSQPDLVSPLSDVGAVWAPHRTQSELEAAERVVQDGLVAASQRQHEPDGGATLLCVPCTPPTHVLQLLRLAQRAPRLNSRLRARARPVAPGPTPRQLPLPGRACL
jgi:hypothetical protein